MRSLAIIPVFREAGKVGRVLERFEPGSVDQICLVLDNPDDQITNGIRAYKASILQDSRIDVWQPWLDGYELEYYLHYKALTLRYRFTERPVTKTYSHVGRRGYSHISPFRDWWQIVGPMFLLRLGVRH